MPPTLDCYHVLLITSILLLKRSQNDMGVLQRLGFLLQGVTAELKAAGRTLSLQRVIGNSLTSNGHELLFLSVSKFFICLMSDSR